MYCVFYNAEFYNRNNGSFQRESDEQFETNMHSYATPLITAIIERRSESLIKSLITKDHIEEVDKSENNSLHLAACIAPYKSEIIKELLRCKNNINVQNKHGDTPLHLCAHNPLCDFNLVKILIDHGANVNIRNSLNETPLFEFIRNCYKEENCEDNFKIIQCLLRNGAAINIQNANKEFPFLMVAELPHFISVKLAEEFLNYKVDVFVRDSLGNTVLHRLASGKKEANIAGFLSKKCPLLLATKNFEGETPLHTVVFHRVSFEVIEALVTNGADVNGCDADGNSPLHLIRSTPFPIINCFIKHGANINCVNKYGCTPLMLSVVYYHFMEETLRALIYFGADLNIRDFNGRSALHYALSSNYMPSKIAQLLLENGADPLNTNFGYQRPIMYCSNNSVISEMYIQYALLNILEERYSNIEDSDSDSLEDSDSNILEDSDEFSDFCMQLMRFDCYRDGTEEILSNFRDRCVHELLLMKRNILFQSIFQEISLFDYLCTGCIYQSIEKTNTDLYMKVILLNLHSQKYKSCKFLFLCCLKQKLLIEYVAKIKICSKNTSDQESHLISSAQNSVETVALNYESILHISKFLDKNSLINLGIAGSL